MLTEDSIVEDLRVKNFTTYKKKNKRKNPQNNFYLQILLGVI